MTNKKISPQASEALRGPWRVVVFDGESGDEIHLADVRWPAWIGIAVMRGEGGPGNCAYGKDTFGSLDELRTGYVRSVAMCAGLNDAYKTASAEVAR